MDKVIEKFYTSKEMCELTKVDERTLKRFNEFLTGDNDDTTQFFKKGGYHNSQNLYTEKALLAFQAWLLKNQANQGKASSTVKENAEHLIEVGALTACVQNNGDIEVAQQLCNLIMSNTKAVAEAKKLAMENEEKQIKLLEQAPKVQDYDNFMNSDGLIAIQDLGKTTKIGARKIFEVLKIQKVIFKVTDSAKPYLFHYEAYFNHKDRFVLKPITIKIENKLFNSFRLFLTPDGFIYFSKKLAVKEA